MAGVVLMTEPFGCSVDGEKVRCVVKPWDWSVATAWLTGWPTTAGTGVRAGAVLTVSATVAPFARLAPALGSCARTVPRGWRLFGSWVVTVGVKPAARSVDSAFESGWCQTGGTECFTAEEPRPSDAD